MLFSSNLLYCQAALLCSSVAAVYTVNRDDWQDSNELGSSEQDAGLGRYMPTWESLDKRPLPTWYDDAKFGIFIHWGVFSVPSFGSEWFWHSWKTEAGSTMYEDFMSKRYPPGFTYQEFAKDFTAEFYDPIIWANLFAASGAKYVVLTSKHHEGYTMWPSKHSFSWNSMDVGPHRDLVGELADAIRNNGKIKFGLYHSLFEWYNPMWLDDKKNNFTTNNFVKSKTLRELHELIDLYKPEILWSDGEWDGPDSYWRSKEFLAWLYNHSPVKDTVVVNDRWGKGTLCHHGDFWTCADRYSPGVLQPHKWENCLTIDRKSWGYRRNAALSDYMSSAELIKELVTTVSCGGNLLVNVGPTKDGIISPIYEERLRQIGDWLSVNGGAIFETRPWKVQNDSLTGDAWYTSSTHSTDGSLLIFCIFLSWPEDDILRLRSTDLPSSGESFFYTKSGEYAIEFKRNNETDAVEMNLPVKEHRDQPAWAIRL